MIDYRCSQQTLEKHFANQTDAYVSVTMLKQTIDDRHLFSVLVKGIGLTMCTSKFFTEHRD